MNKKKHYLIYQITNNINQKFYIGKHETYNIDDDYFGSGKYLRRAIRKHGIENFTKTILFELQNREEMNLLEKTVVTPEFCARKDTYNLTIGGFGTWFKPNQRSTKKRHEKMMEFLSRKTPEELTQWKKHMVKIRDEWWNSLTDQQKQHFISILSSAKKKHIELFGHPFQGKKHSEETKKKMSEKAKKRVGKLNSSFGTMWICNDETHESKKILKTDNIPTGWRKGRFMH